MGLESRIRKKPIPDPGPGPGVKKAPDPGSATLGLTLTPSMSPKQAASLSFSSSSGFVMFPATSLSYFQDYLPIIAHKWVLQVHYICLSEKFICRTYLGNLTGTVLYHAVGDVCTVCISDFVKHWLAKHKQVFIIFAIIVPKMCPPPSPEKKEHKNAIWDWRSAVRLGPSEQVLHFLHELLVGVVLGKLGLSLLHLQG